jgi:hypothetical protein
MVDALAEMKSWLLEPTDLRRERLRELLSQVQGKQNEYRNIKWGAVRIVSDWPLLLIEYGLRCLLSLSHEAGHWAYQLARRYAERYSPSAGTGLTTASAALLQDIADFWIQEFGLDSVALVTPASEKRRTTPSVVAGKRSPAAKDKARFTHRQGQFLAFIHLYRQLHRQGPAELDLVKFFRVSPPAVHDMIVRLEDLGLIAREPGIPRSVRVSIPYAELPQLEDV